MSDTVNFSIERAKRTGDSSAWTALDALRDLISRIEKKETPAPDKMCVVYLYKDDDGVENYGRVTSNLNLAEQAGLLSLAVNLTIKDWTNQ